jgi:hypothetical protein
MALPASSTLGVARQVEGQGAAVADHGDLADRRIHLARGLAGFATGFAAGGGEQFEVDAFVAMPLACRLSRTVSVISCGPQMKAASRL